ncbi:MAG: hypothetical protein P8078_03080, partial [bacterium]
MHNIRDTENKLDILLSEASPALVGLGNTDRADDGFGLKLAERLKPGFPTRFFSESDKAVEGIVYDFLESHFDLIIFADAVHFKG